MKQLLLVLLVLIVLVGTGVAFTAPDSPDLFWWTVDGGGAVPQLSGGSFTLRGTTGQPDAGSLSNGSYTLSGGFWNPAVSDPTYLIYLPITNN